MVLSLLYHITLYSITESPKSCHVDVGRLMDVIITIFMGIKNLSPRPRADNEALNEAVVFFCVFLTAPVNLQIFRL